MNYINNSIIGGKKFLLAAPNDTARRNEQWLRYTTVSLIKQTNMLKCSQLHATSTHLILYPLQY